MAESPDRGLNANAAYVAVAVVSAGASCGIAMIALSKLTQITDSGMWAIAAMTLAPTLLGIGVSFFIHRTARASQAAVGSSPPPQAITVLEGAIRAGRPFEGPTG